MNISIIGTGYVGLVTGACFAELGNRVFCVDSDIKKIALLKKGFVRIYEPGLEEMVKRNAKKGRISFSASIKDSIKTSDVIFICVGTPSRESGEADLSYLESVSQEIAKSLDSYKLIVEKSTVPVETGEWVKRTVERFKGEKIQFDIASNPEFLREGTAIEDFMHPDRIVIGAESENAKKTLLALYKPLKAPFVVTDIKGAEIIKHASNSFLAMKISFINALSVICDKAGADIREVARGIGFDRRIGKNFLEAGAGFGGSCFPKDLRAFIHIAEKLGYKFDLLREVEKINEAQKDIVVEKVSKLIWNIAAKTICIWGISFKPDTDDIRNAPSIGIIRKLISQGGKVRVYDPKAMENAKEIFKKEITYSRNPYDAAKGSDCLVLLTEWEEFKKADFKKVKELLKQPVIVDGRNIYDREEMRKLGFVYSGMGR